MSTNNELIEAIQDLTESIRSLNGSIESLEKKLDTQDATNTYLGGKLDDVKEGLEKLARKL